MKIEHYRQRITALQRSYGLRRPEDLLHQYALRIDELSTQLSRNMLRNLTDRKQYLQQLNLRLQNLSPKKVLERGYSITYLDGKVLKKAGKARVNGMITTELYRGKIESQITKIEDHD